MNSHLYVKRLYLKDIRCYSELEINLEEPQQSILVVGDNGQGKSTILRSLAMGLCDQSSASALFRELPGEFVRHGANGDGIIEVDLAGSGPYTYRMRTTIRSLKTFERVEQRLFRFHGSKETELTQDEFPWERIFASGYGAGIRVEGSQDYSYYLTVDAVYSLFRYDAQLQNPELIVRRIVDEGSLAGRSSRRRSSLRKLKRLLEQMLDLEKSDRVELTHTGIQIQGDWGYADLASAGDGYRSTITWVVDLIAWSYLKAYHEKTDATPDKLSGIVLIDEIEQHLHPKWQRNVVRKLRRAFPGIQLIATTHSPIVASGCEDVEVHRVAKGDHTVEHPFGWLAEDVYRMMGLKSSRAKSFLKDMTRYAALDERRLAGLADSEDLAEFESLRHHVMATLPPGDPLVVSQELANLSKRIRALRKK